MTVYFIQAGSNSGPIKIGTANDLWRRFYNVQIHNHELLSLLAAVPGGRRREKFFHALFAGQRIRGEWFAFGGCLAKAMAVIQLRYPPPPPTIRPPHDALIAAEFVPSGQDVWGGRDSGVWEGMPLGVRARLSAAVDHLRKTGSLRRADIQRLGEVSTPQASNDINEIKRRMPKLMEYDPSEKCYRLRTQ